MEVSVLTEEQRRKRRDYMREYYRKHPEKNRNHVRDWRKRNPEKKHAQDKLYRQRHKEQEARKVNRWSKTPFGKSYGMFRAIKLRQERYGFGELSFSLNEFRTWLFNKTQFGVLFNQWVSSGYQRNLTPTVDRIDNNKGYAFDNMQIITNLENIVKSDGTSSGGKLKPILGYPSQRQAAKHLGINERELSVAIKKAKNIGEPVILKNIVIHPDGTGLLFDIAN